MSVVLVDIDDHVAHLRLNRPEKRNAIDDEMFAALIHGTESVCQDPQVRAVVISGEGRSFCAGLDLAVHKTFAAEGAAGERPYADPDEPDAPGLRRPGRGQRIVAALRAAPVPVVVALHGHAIGAGLQIALGADLRLATPAVKLGCAEIDFGMTVDMGASQLLAPLIGPDRALDLLLTGRLLSGADAAAWGLVTRLCDDPVAEAVALARAFAGRNPTAVRASKRLVRMTETATPEEGLKEELRVMAANIGSPEQVEAVAAYFALREGLQA